MFYSVLNVSSDCMTFNGVSVDVEDLPDIFKKWRPSVVELHGDFVSGDMIEAMRLALRYKVGMHSNSAATRKGMDQLVTGSLHSVN